MKRLIGVAVTALFAGAVSAASTYHGLEDGNAELGGDRTGVNNVTGVQPGVGDSVDLYHGWAEGNTDLFQRQIPDSARSEDPDVYQSFGQNPDLTF